ncbi:unnamed protein product, partial [Closterium sp. Naga37s-1]
NAGNERGMALGARPFDDAARGVVGEVGLRRADLFELAAEAGREWEARRGRNGGKGRVKKM